MFDCGVVDEQVYDLVINGMSTIVHLLGAAAKYGTLPGAASNIDEVMRAKGELDQVKARTANKIVTFRNAAGNDVRLTRGAIARIAKMLLTARNEGKPGADRITDNNVSRMIFEHCVMFSLLSSTAIQPQLVPWREDPYEWVSAWYPSQTQNVQGSPFTNNGLFDINDLDDLANMSPLVSGFDNIYALCGSIRTIMDHSHLLVRSCSGLTTWVQNLEN